MPSSGHTEKNKSATFYICGGKFIFIISRVLCFRLHLVYGSSSEPCRPRNVRLFIHHHHLHFTRLTSDIYFFGPNGGSLDTSGRGTLFLYTAVNKMLISFYTLGCPDALNSFYLFFFCYAQTRRTKRTKSAWSPIFK